MFSAEQFLFEENNFSGLKNANLGAICCMLYFLEFSLEN
jgi:hypothetical protein